MRVQATRTSNSWLFTVPKRALTQGLPRFRKKRRALNQGLEIGLVLISALLIAPTLFAEPPNLRPIIPAEAAVACPVVEKPYEVRDFALNFPKRGQIDEQRHLKSGMNAGTNTEIKKWALRTATKISAECANALAGVWIEPEVTRFSTLNDQDLLQEFGFEPAVEANNRGVSLLKTSREFIDLQNALRLFQFAANRGHAQAFANLALTQFALSNLEQSAFAAEVGALLKQDEAVLLLAYFKVEAIHVDKDLAQAQALLQTLQAKGVDTTPVSSLDMSYQFFPAHWVALQKALKRVGLFNGETDGIFGEDSKRALTSFQQREGLPVTTKLNLALLDRLDLLQDFNQEIEAQKYIYGKF